MFKRFTQKLLLIITCSFALNLLPISTVAWAQEGVIGGVKKGVEKGAEGVKKGAEWTGEKTKEGAEEVGKGVKDVFTDDDDQDKDRMKPDQAQPATQPSDTGTQKAEPRTTRPAGTESREKPGTSAGTDNENSNLPNTAGELPLLALVGAAALAGAGARKAVRRTK